MEKHITYQQIIQQVANKINLPEEVVDKTYKAFWLCIKNQIEKLPLKEDISAEEFDALDTSFNIPSLGKLVCQRDRYEAMKKYFNEFKEEYD